MEKKIQKTRDSGPNMKRTKQARKTRNIHTQAKNSLRRLFCSIYKHLMIRPRLRLVSKLILIALLLLIPLGYVSKAIAENRDKVVLNGHKILVAEGQLPRTADDINDVDQQITPAKSPFQFHMPVDGYISQGFSGYHNGVDIATNFGRPIHPLGEGIVVFAGFMNDGHGNTVIVDHGSGLRSLYAHMDRIYAGVGNHVDGEAPIGTIGLTGHTTGPHVHIELTDNNIAVDPQSVLPN